MAYLCVVLHSTKEKCIVLKVSYFSMNYWRTHFQHHVLLVALAFTWLARWAFVWRDWGNPQKSTVELRFGPRYYTVAGNSRGCHLSPSSPESRGPPCLRLWPGLPQDKVEPVMWQHENQAAAVPSSQMGEPLYSAKHLWLNNTALC